MSQVFDQQAPKKAANLSINSDLLAQAKKLKINLSATLEKTLVAELSKKKEQAWLAENKEAIAEFNQRIEKQGLFSDALRTF
ncbi:MAG: type II toxin-antitoxin system CcdA family antitoxin [Mariprofundaceae bacterium]|nr:type II toxin-antitoxin system CcdA family antitoxin [Mariprofundaceae bacterium]